MSWQLVEIPIESKGKNSPYASVGFGRLSLSVAACELIDNYDGFSYVQLLKDNTNNQLCVGIRFLKECEPNSIKIARKTIKGKTVGGIDIANSKVLQSLFGMAATAKKVTRYNIKKDESYNNILVVYPQE